MRKSLYGTGLTALATVIVMMLTGVFSRSDALAITWVIAKCDKGKIASAHYDEKGGGTVVVGSASACLLNILNSEVGVAVYEAGATTVNVLSYRMRKVESSNTRNCKSESLLTLRCDFGVFISKKTGTFGICVIANSSLLSGEKDKLGCAKLVFRNSAYVELSSLATTDALVNARISGKEIAVDPRCGSCW